MRALSVPAVAGALVALLLVAGLPAARVRAGEPLGWYAVPLYPSATPTSTSVWGAPETGYGQLTIVGLASIPASDCSLIAYATEAEAAAAADAGASAQPQAFWVVEQAIDAPHAIGQAEAALFASQINQPQLQPGTNGYNALVQGATDSAERLCSLAQGYPFASA
jgi:hypothetical protein